MQVQLITLAGRGEGRQGLLAGKEQSEEGAANAEEWVTVLGLGKRQAIGAGVMVGGSGCRQLRQVSGLGLSGLGLSGLVAADWSTFRERRDGERGRRS